jgi:NADH-quinone oxidoreductase subunit L
MTFYGESRVSHEAAHHLHESPSIMTVPLMILAFLSLVGGLVGIPIIQGGHNFGEWLAPVFAPAKAILDAGHHGHGGHSVALELILMAVSLGIAIVGLLFARWMYVTKPDEAGKMVTRFGAIHTLVYNKYWIDEIYDVLFVNSIVGLSRFLWKRFDEAVIDGIVNGSASVVRGWSSLMRRAQTGLVKDYALSILVGVVVVIGYLVLK